MQNNEKRYNFINLIRVIACLVIMIYHYFNSLGILGIRQFESMEFLYKTRNMNMATVAVGLFFMISGSGLMLSSDAKENFSAISFYKTRIIKIIIPFYVSYFLYIFIQLAIFRMPISVLFEGRPLYSIVFTILGMDGYLSLYGVKTFYLGIGEWFLFPLLIMYLLFPLLRKLIKKNRIVAFCTMTAFFLFVTLLYDKIPYMNLIPCYTNVFVKIYEFFLGMLLITLIDEIPGWLFIIASAPVIWFYLTCAYYLQDNEAIRILIQNVSFFLFFAGFERLFKKLPKSFHALSVISRYTYPAFLIHHVFETLIPPVLAPIIPYQKNSSLLILFVAILFFVSLAAILITFVSDKITNLIYRKKKNA